MGKHSKTMAACSPGREVTEDFDAAAEDARIKAELDPHTVAIPMAVRPITTMGDTTVMCGALDLDSDEIGHFTLCASDLVKRQQERGCEVQAVPVTTIGRYKLFAMCHDPSDDSWEALAEEVRS